MGKCSHPECNRADKITRGLCPKHYARLLRTGSADTVRPPGVPGDGHTKHPLYVAWGGMVNRCHNPNNSSYGRYGAKGIVVCDRWRNFNNFLADMGERPAGKTLDRIDPLGPYAPGNCRWATVVEQRRNISSDGDARMRKAVSDGVKTRWAKWRAAKSGVPSATREPIDGNGSGT